MSSEWGSVTNKSVCCWRYARLFSDLCVWTVLWWRWPLGQRMWRWSIFVSCGFCGLAGEVGLKVLWGVLEMSCVECSGLCSLCVGIQVCVAGRSSVYYTGIWWLQICVGYTISPWPFLTTPSLETHASIRVLGYFPTSVDSVYYSTPMRHSGVSMPTWQPSVQRFSTD
jgi:hypothetical protein